MAWVLLNTRRAELIRDINTKTYEKLKLQREIRKLSAFSTAIADGNVTPDELSSLSSYYLGEAVKFNDMSYEHAYNKSEYATNYYMEQYEGLTQDEYFMNSSLNSRVSLYWNQDTGTLDEELIRSNLLEQYMKEYVEQYVEPKIKELEDEYEEQKLELETQVTAEEAELEQIAQKVRENQQKDTINV